jgi:hypothetical protein
MYSERRFGPMLFLCALGVAPFLAPQKVSTPSPVTYLGFDRNDYPGDEALPLLRKTFSFASYWLGAPPGEKRGTWQGKRASLASQGFGFAVLFSGRESRQLKSASYAQQVGSKDADSAANYARGEGFPDGTVIFLDIEEGGRLPDTYHEYLQTWRDTLAKAGFRAGVYCSAMPVDEGGGATITTAQDIQAHIASPGLVYWVYNDACPPAPGCAFSADAPAPAQSGFPAATIWQYAQSPRRTEFTAHCPAHYAADGNCYATGDAQHRWFLDVNVANTPDPSSSR